MIEFRTQLQPRKRTPLSFKDTKSMVRPEFKDETDINKLIKHYSQQEIYEGYLHNVQVFADTTGMEFHDMQCMVAEGNSSFMELPSNIRYRFDNDPVKFLTFIQDPKNEEELINMKLANTRILDEAKKGVPAGGKAEDLPPVGATASPKGAAEEEPEGES